MERGKKGRALFDVLVCNNYGSLDDPVCNLAKGVPSYLLSKGTAFQGRILPTSRLQHPLGHVEGLLNSHFICLINSLLKTSLVVSLAVEIEGEGRA